VRSRLSLARARLGEPDARIGHERGATDQPATGSENAA
jgi:hypothetical protein